MAPTDEPAPRIDWRKTGLAVLIIAAELAVELIITVLKLPALTQVIIFSIAAVLTMIAMMALYWDILQPAWRAFRTHLWRRLLLLLLLSLAIKIVVVIFTLVLVLSTHLKTGTTANIAPLVTNTKPLIIAIVPALLAAPFYEELFFRHVLYYQWRARRGLGIVMMLVSSVIFGFFHWGNVQGVVILTIPFMLIGLTFAVIYRRQQNIWYNITTHFMYNFSTVLVALLALLR
ncbi:CPBP family intramembrane glutamic endopeptidase [Schleiferilactobacillus shenzhenensis]|uniref:CAAX prenyl protease 2/Lysostaphin resistance protein A-like domain-containing protein n=1 Tax=Schleiferilactobacillus shenzhenensis LY-73 TaxID=1231336 RepID=U4TKD9_9LACO|nr:type II CAAX endopeptidase family protein [Schleiferilactobacillus shenzhenensis]ERL65306.1 hypothetical protein L248_2705 [Schleiferilactobacillus shenzhenensis LY-73]